MQIGLSFAGDNFTRANNASIGAAWSELDTALTIASNQGSITGTSVDTIEKWVATTFPANQSSTLKIGTGSTALLSSWNVFVRLTDTNNFYGFGIDNSVSNTYTLFKVVTGSFTSLKTGTKVVSAGDIMRIEAIGTSLVVKVNGVVIDSTTDSSLTTGQPGIGLSTTGAATCTVASWQGSSL